MVNRPTTTKELQAHCANALFKAASYIEDAKPEALKTAKVSVLLTHPDMFSSEICVFFDEQYFEWFFDRNGEEHKLTKLSSGSLAKELNLIIPQGFSEVGYKITMKNEYDGEVSIHKRIGGFIVKYKLSTFTQKNNKPSNKPIQVNKT